MFVSKLCCIFYRIFRSFQVLRFPGTQFMYTFIGALPEFSELFTNARILQLIYTNTYKHCFL